LEIQLELVFQRINNDKNMFAGNSTEPVIWGKPVFTVSSAELGLI